MVVSIVPALSKDETLLNEFDRCLSQIARITCERHPSELDLAIVHYYVLRLKWLREQLFPNGATRSARSSSNTVPPQ
jgi:hypothetical protein